MNKLIKQAILDVTGTEDAEKFARINGTAAKIAEKVLELVKQHSIGETHLDWDEGDDGLYPCTSDCLDNMVECSDVFKQEDGPQHVSVILLPVES